MAAFREITDDELFVILAGRDFLLSFGKARTTRGKTNEKDGEKTAGHFGK